MAEDVGFEFLEDFRAPVPDVLLIEHRPIGYVLLLPTRKVVHDRDLVAASEELVGYVRAYKAGSAGQEHPHPAAHPASGSASLRALRSALRSANQPIVRDSPSLAATRGSQPNTSRARLMSGHRCFGSSWGSGS